MAHAPTMSADVLEEAVGPFVAYAATAKAPVPIKSRCVCVSLASEMPNPNPLHPAKTFADVQSGDALMVVVECVRPPRRRTLCRRRDLVIIQEALRAVHALQAELVTEGLVRRETFLAGSTALNSAARDFLADCTALSARRAPLHFGAC